jgi:polyferredoxin
MTPDLPMNAASGRRPPDWPARLGELLRNHRGAIVALQWTVVLCYTVLVAVPAFLPLPPEDAGILDDLTRFAQFIFWGIWWPFVIVSIMAMGRLWCGLFCPEGALSEWASRYGLGRGIPRWMKWGGWPFVAFICTTVFGQMVSVYEYPKPALLILGGSTVAAVAVGLAYGRDKRVWCRHLCPVSGVFALLAKIAPVHFRVDAARWDAAPAGERSSRTHLVNCAPLIDIRRMDSASSCHMCGRCAGHRGAVALALRAPGAEVLAPPATARFAAVAQARERWLARLLVWGLLGVALGAFQWTSSPWFVSLKQTAAEWLVGREIFWPLEQPGHWWLLTHYPEASDVFTWLDGGALLAYIGAVSLIIGSWLQGWLALAARSLGMQSWRVVLALVPLGGISAFVGLSLLTTTQLAAERIVVPGANLARMALLGLAAAWSVWFVWRMGAGGRPPRRIAAVACTAAAAAAPLGAWYLQFFVW